MRRAFIALTGLIATLACQGQRENFSYKFYGFVRGDIYYNSRINAEAVDGTFYLYPLNKKLDTDGKDLNAVSNSSFYTFTTRLGIDANGPRARSAETSAKVEADFAGTSGAFYLLRIRQAYVNFKWKQRSSLLLEQTWHPLFGDFHPDVLDLCTGGPFQPFNRSPQIRYQYTAERFTVTGSAIYQLMSVSAGPAGKVEDYTKNGIVPELFAGINYHKDGFIGGVGIEMLSLKPRTSSVVDGKERI